MQDSSIPTKIVLPFANGAGAGFITSPIPVPSQIGATPNAASYTDGFPPQTFQAGGYPRGSDFNGLLNVITAWNRWQAAGGPNYYDSAFSASIGGYPAGSLLNATSALGNYWISTIDNNTSNPDTGGANWLAASMIATAGRLLNIQYFRTGGTYTPTAGANNGLVKSMGGGGGSGELLATGAGQASTGGAGGSGAYAEKWVTGLTTQTVTIGAGGHGGSVAYGSTGTTGGTTSFGSILVTAGGAGGSAGAVGTVSTSGGGSGAAAPTTGDLNIGGSPGSGSFYVSSVTFYGPGGAGLAGSLAGYGAGGEGQVQGASTSANVGIDGRPGILIVYEYA